MEGMRLLNGDFGAVFLSVCRIAVIVITIRTVLDGNLNTGAGMGILCDFRVIRISPHRCGIDSDDGHHIGVLTGSHISAVIADTVLIVAMGNGKGSGFLLQIDARTAEIADDFYVHKARYIMGAAVGIAEGIVFVNAVIVIMHSTLMLTGQFAAADFTYGHIGFANVPAVDLPAGYIFLDYDFIYNRSALGTVLFLDDAAGADMVVFGNLEIALPGEVRIGYFGVCMLTGISAIIASSVVIENVICVSDLRIIVAAHGESAIGTYAGEVYPDFVGVGFFIFMIESHDLFALVGKFKFAVIADHGVFAINTCAVAVHLMSGLLRVIFNIFGLDDAVAVVTPGIIEDITLEYVVLIILSCADFHVELLRGDSVLVFAGIVAITDHACAAFVVVLFSQDQLTILEAIFGVNTAILTCCAEMLDVTDGMAVFADFKHEDLCGSEILVQVFKIQIVVFDSFLMHFFAVDIRAAIAQASHEVIDEVHMGVFVNSLRPLVVDVLLGQLDVGMLACGRILAAPAEAIFMDIVVFKNLVICIKHDGLENLPAEDAVGFLDQFADKGVLLCILILTCIVIEFFGELYTAVMRTGVFDAAPVAMAILAPFVGPGIIPGLAGVREVIGITDFAVEITALILLDGMNFIIHVLEEVLVLAADFAVPICPAVFGALMGEHSFDVFNAVVDLQSADITYSLFSFAIPDAVAFIGIRLSAVVLNYDCIVQGRVIAGGFITAIDTSVVFTDFVLFENSCPFFSAFDLKGLAALNAVFNFHEVSDAAMLLAIKALHVVFPEFLNGFGFTVCAGIGVAAGSTFAVDIIVEVLLLPEFTGAFGNCEFTAAVLTEPDIHQLILNSMCACILIHEVILIRICEMPFISQIFRLGMRDVLYLVLTGCDDLESAYRTVSRHDLFIFNLMPGIIHVIDSVDNFDFSLVVQRGMIAFGLIGHEAAVTESFFVQHMGFQRGRFFFNNGLSDALPTGVAVGHIYNIVGDLVLLTAGNGSCVVLVVFTFYRSVAVFADILISADPACAVFIPFMMLDFLSGLGLIIDQHGAVAIGTDVFVHPDELYVMIVRIDAGSEIFSLRVMDIIGSYRVAFLDVRLFIGLPLSAFLLEGHLTFGADCRGNLFIPCMVNLCVNIPAIQLSGFLCVLQRGVVIAASGTVLAEGTYAVGIEDMVVVFNIAFFKQTLFKDGSADAAAGIGIAVALFPMRGCQIRISFFELAAFVAFKLFPYVVYACMVTVRFIAAGFAHAIYPVVAMRLNLILFNFDGRPAVALGALVVFLPDHLDVVVAAVDGFCLSVAIFVVPDVPVGTMRQVGIMVFQFFVVFHNAQINLQAAFFAVSIGTVSADDPVLAFCLVIAVILSFVKLIAGCFKAAVVANGFKAAVAVTFLIEDMVIHSDEIVVQRFGSQNLLAIDTSGDLCLNTSDPVLGIVYMVPLFIPDFGTGFGTVFMGAALLPSADIADIVFAPFVGFVDFVLYVGIPLNIPSAVGAVTHHKVGYDQHMMVVIKFNALVNIEAIEFKGCIVVGANVSALAAEYVNVFFVDLFIPDPVPDEGVGLFLGGGDSAGFLAHLHAAFIAIYTGNLSTRRHADMAACAVGSCAGIMVLIVFKFNFRKGFGVLAFFLAHCTAGALEGINRFVVPPSVIFDNAVLYFGIPLVHFIEIGITIGAVGCVYHSVVNGVSTIFIVNILVANAFIPFRFSFELTIVAVFMGAGLVSVHIAAVPAHTVKSISDEVMFYFLHDIFHFGFSLVQLAVRTPTAIEANIIFYVALSIDACKNIKAVNPFISGIFMRTLVCIAAHTCTVGQIVREVHCGVVIFEFCTAVLACEDNTTIIDMFIFIEEVRFGGPAAILIHRNR